MDFILINTPEGRKLVKLYDAVVKRVAVLHHYNNSDMQHQINFGMENPSKVIEWMLNDTEWHSWKDYFIQYDYEKLVSKESFWQKIEDFRLIEDCARVPASVTFEVMVDCPYCGCEHDVREELYDELSQGRYDVKDIAVDMICEECGESFIINETEY